MILESSNIVYRNALNIFTDASVTNTTISLPGYIMVDGRTGNTLKYCNVSLCNSTNNEGEVYAIYMALKDAIPMIANMELTYGDRLINIFSDSKITIFGLREWYKNWIKNMRDGILVSSSGQLVANQSIYIRIMKMIHDYDLKVNFYHVSGHVNINNMKEVYKAMQDFSRFNNGIQISLEFAKLISDYNDQIDLYSRTASVCDATDYKNSHLFKPIIDGNFDMHKYKVLTQRRI